MHFKKLVSLLVAEPIAGLEHKTEEAWALLIQNKFNEKEYFSRPCTAEELKLEIVEHARQTWPIEFSQQFMVSPACHLPGKQKEE